MMQLPGDILRIASQNLVYARFWALFPRSNRYLRQMEARVAARFLQAEATIGAMMDIQIGTLIPIIQ